MSFSSLTTANINFIIRKFLLLSFILFTIKANSQDVVNGYVRDSLTHFAIVGATVTNTTNKLMVTTNINGFFQVKASANDFFLCRPNRTSSTP